jgi:ribosomal protein S18 acetylase RimI-like enzyme
VATLTAFEEEHLAGVLVLFQAEGWPSYTADPKRTLQALSSAGSVTLVALENDAVVGVAQVQSDGEIQAHLSIIAVAREHRRRGLGRTLLREALRRSGGLRVDAISTDDDFYIGLGARRFSGFRLSREELGLPDPGRGAVTGL